MRRCLQSFRSCYLRFVDFSHFSICATDVVYLTHQRDTLNTREKCQRSGITALQTAVHQQTPVRFTSRDPTHTANERNRSAVLLLVWHNTSPSSQILTACSLAMRLVRKSGTFSPDSIPTIKHLSISNLCSQKYRLHKDANLQGYSFCNCSVSFPRLVPVHVRVADTCCCVSALLSGSSAAAACRV